MSNTGIFNTNASFTISPDDIVKHVYGGVEHPVYVEDGFGPSGYYFKPEGQERLPISDPAHIENIQKQIADGLMTVTRPFSFDFKNPDMFELESNLNDTADRIQAQIRADQYSFGANRDGITLNSGLKDVFTSETKPTRDIKEPTFNPDGPDIA